MQRELPGIESGRERIDNISDTALRAFRVRYNDNTITKDARRWSSSWSGDRLAPRGRSGKGSREELA